MDVSAGKRVQRRVQLTDAHMRKLVTLCRRCAFQVWGDITLGDPGTGEYSGLRSGPPTSYYINVALFMLASNVGGAYSHVK